MRTESAPCDSSAPVLDPHTVTDTQIYDILVNIVMLPNLPT